MPLPGEHNLYGGVCIAGICVAWPYALAYTILAIYVAVRTAMLMRREPLQTVVSDIAREIAAAAVVFFFVAYLPTYIKAPDNFVEKFQAVVNESYIREVKFQQCVANIRLSGPFAAYAGYAEAKYSKYGALYTTAIQLYSQLVGMGRFLVEYGPAILSTALMLYAAWLRRISGVVIGIVVGLIVGAAIAADVAFSSINKLAPDLQKMDFHPLVDLGCDDKLIGKYSQDYAEWQRAVYLAIFTMFAVPAIAAAAGYLLTH